ncbi:uncharacterized protein LOC100678198 [Nasonia vitripennis]|uniref:Uncharacterized protein n=1 Tax=Nasonia vitripennis TaxID=7425 RepID=A0A7M7QHY5_NASVI|nr:uncharacterized protein LOC100678198 [Nasonia vitripennis]
MDKENHLQLIIVWINILNVIQSIIDNLDQSIRRWWTKPDITEQQRLCFGAFSTIFAYMKNNNHEKLYDYIGMLLEQFEYLYALVGNKLEKRSRRTSLPAELRLAATLYYLRNGGSIKMCASVFRIGTSTMYSIVPEVCRALYETLRPIYIPLPGAIEWRIIANGFKDKWNFPNCLGAVDGRHFSIETPPNSGSFFLITKNFPAWF